MGLQSALALNELRTVRARAIQNTDVQNRLPKECFLIHKKRWTVPNLYGTISDFEIIDN